jgi:GT2 family glycosyltransferase
VISETFCAVITTRNRPQYLERCLQALLSQEEPVEEILVIDQSVGSASASICRLAGSLVRRIPDEGTGLSRARNIGVRCARGDIIAFIDDDCYVEPTWSAAIRAVFERHPSAGGVFGEMLGGGDHPDDPDGIEVATISFDRELLHTDVVEPYRVGFGGNMALRRGAWEALGSDPCDPRLGAGTRNPGGDDMDLIFRLLRAGIPLVSAPSSRALHDQWRPPQAMPRQMYGYGRGYGAFSTKHAARGSRRALGLLGRQALADARFIASGVRRRSLRRFLIGLCRLAGTARGVVSGIVLARDPRW